jgi:putative ABC transport system permease protein
VKFLPLLWKNLTRKKLRATFTFLSILFAFLLYGVLAAAENAFSGGVDLAGADRLRMIHKMSVILALPTRYLEPIAATEGVRAVSYLLWFGGFYQEPRNFFTQLAVHSETYLDVYPEYLLPEEQRRRWLATRTGAVAGRALAARFGWQIGDRIPIQSTIYKRRDGSPAWEFTLEGIFEGAESSVDEMQLLFHHKYLEEAGLSGEGEVRWFAIRIEDPAEAHAVADRLDRQFVNSPFETETSTEKAFLQSFANQVGDTGAILTAVTGTVFLVILLVAGSTVAQSVRERTAELATLKALGFGNGLVLALVLAESLILCGLAGGLGLGISWLAIHGGGLTSGVPARGLQSMFHLTLRDLTRGLLLVLALGGTSGALPALSAMRLRIVQALRKG